MTALIRSDGLTKTFRGPGGTTIEAVRDLTMEIDQGSLTAFLGPNGAGKSTSLRMLTTLLPPTSGRATVCGYDVATQPAAVRRSIGYIGQKNGSGQYYQVRDELMSQAAFYGLGRGERRRRVDELVEALGLGELLKRTTQQLSGGQRRRVDIALGLIPAPRLLFLDEPSSGLDPQSRAHLWEHVLRLRERYEMTLLLTTHYLEEADHFAERVMVVDEGRIIADDTSESLKNELVGDRIRLVLDAAGVGEETLVHEARRILHPFAADGTGQTLIRTGGDGESMVIEATCARGDEALPALVTGLSACGPRVHSADLCRPSLDDVFLHLTGRSLREETTAVTPQKDTPEPTVPATIGENA